MGRLPTISIQSISEHDINSIWASGMQSHHFLADFVSHRKVAMFWFFLIFYEYIDIMGWFWDWVNLIDQLSWTPNARITLTFSEIIS